MTMQIVGHRQWHEQGRVEKRLHRAFRRMFDIRRITPATPTHLPYAGCFVPLIKYKQGNHMPFTDEFIKSLQNDPITGAMEICRTTFEELELEPRRNPKEIFELLAAAYYLLLELKETGMFNIGAPFPELSGDMDSDIEIMTSFLNFISRECETETTKLTVQSMRAQYRMALGNSFAYEFSQGDLERVQVLVNELRDAISATRSLEKEHQQRLLQRLERLQSELHKRVSDLDRFWGLIGDAGVVLAKLGNDAKPIVDRIREIAGIVWQTQSRTEELPSGAKLPVLDFKKNEEA